MRKEAEFTARFWDKLNQYLKEYSVNGNMLTAKEPLRFKDLIPKLKFITNKMWTGHLRRVMRTIKKEDYDLIFSAINWGVEDE